MELWISGDSCEHQQISCREAIANSHLEHVEHTLNMLNCRNELWNHSRTASTIDDVSASYTSMGSQEWTSPLHSPIRSRGWKYSMLHNNGPIRYRLFHKLIWDFILLRLIITLQTHFLHTPQCMNCWNRIRLQAICVWATNY